MCQSERRARYAWRRMFPLVNAGIARDPGRDGALCEAAGPMRWSRSRLSRQPTRMEGRGLVRREEVARDGRGAEAVLTPSGVRAVTTAAPLHVRSVRRHLIDALTPAQPATLAEVGETPRHRLGGPRTQ
ncbi:MarR family transcriptional regulator [Streptomyces sp. NPDC048507]|uniref:MarR family transcriptional regulator n=1 Tax=Streptomyces sp. NPDC048507 TaxID=3365560 RepID=UPI0037231B4B